MVFNFQEWYYKIGKDDSIVCYSGEITEELVKNTLYKVEPLMLKKGLDKCKIKNANNIIIEGIQNLYHHSIANPDDSQSDKFGAFCIRLINNDISIVTGNYVLVDAEEHLKSIIDNINTLSKNEIKILYHELLSNTLQSSKTSGGLGMVDIAKRINSKIDYSFFECNNKHSFLELMIRM